MLKQKSSSVILLILKGNMYAVYKIQHKYTAIIHWLPANSNEL